MVLPNGILYLKVLTKTFNSEKYADLLENNVIPILNLNCPYYYLVQDNSKIHTSKRMQTFFKESDINVLQWPAVSPDLNIMENIWKMLSDEVYKLGQPQNTKELTIRVFEAMGTLMTTKRNVILNLYQNYLKRLTYVLKHRGNQIN